MAAFAEMKVRRCCSLLRCGLDVVVVKVVVVKVVVEKVVVVKAVVEKAVVVKGLWRRWLWLSVGMLVVVEKVAVDCVVEKVVVVVEMRLVQNNDSKRKILPQRSQPGYTNNCLLDIGGEI